MVFTDNCLVLWIISNVMLKCMEVRPELCKSAAELFRPLQPYPTGDGVKCIAVAYAGISLMLLALL